MFSSEWLQLLPIFAVLIGKQKKYPRMEAYQKKIKNAEAQAIHLLFC